MAATKILVVEDEAINRFKYQENKSGLNGGYKYDRF
jgi:hypothetical protein